MVRYCYQAATCNAGNYISQEVTKHMFRDLYDPFVTQFENSQTMQSTSSTLKQQTQQSKFSNSITKQKFFSINTNNFNNNSNEKQDLTQSNISSLKNENEMIDTESKLEILKTEKKWHEFESNVRSTLQWRSPAKHSNGPSAHNFTRQVAKLMIPVEEKLHEATEILTSFPNSTSMLQAMASSSTTTATTSSEIPNVTRLSPLNRSYSSISQTTNDTNMNFTDKTNTTMNTNTTNTTKLSNKSSLIKVQTFSKTK